MTGVVKLHNKINSIYPIVRLYANPTSGTEEDICLSCPFADCKNPLTCERYKEQKKLLPDIRKRVK